MAKFAVVVTSPAHANRTATAVAFVRELLQSPHELIGVFFYQDGVTNANLLTSIPADEYQAPAQWRALNKEHKLNLHLCITAAEKRGMTDDAAQNNICGDFIISGLGELVELTNSCDRVIQL
ncbi:sulfurtransferase complex subunit TusD [Thalassotalea atypica]|uniref:sulfurtransferase complex subunit TusD n=1 Tax=Thalassotalea atypica TaxID=2054316 RepID=UPI00257414BA|nr:sulfurtransferase complex subunit TusD [Thalassotalea atypica]